MTIQIGSIQLDDSLYLAGIENAPDVSVFQQVTLGGVSHLSVMGMPGGGRTLTLTAASNGGRLAGVYKRSQILDIKALAATGVSVALQHHTGVYQVLIVKVEAEPVFVHADPGPDDWYTGTITMIEV